MGISPFRLRMRSCLRPSIPLHHPILPIISRQIHPSIRRQASTFTEDSSDTHNSAIDDADDSLESDHFGRFDRDEAEYARKVNRENVLRWQQNQEPRGKLQFMSLGREFTFPYNLSSISQMSLNHQRELRAYYRKIMYEMPQFKSLINLWIWF